jgi:hypothetical protein
VDGRARGKPCLYVKSECIADRRYAKRETPNRMKSTGARKFSRGVTGIHSDGSRTPSDVFNTLARASLLQRG